MPRPPKAISDDKYIENMQNVLWAIARSKEATAKERIEAAREAAKLLYIKHKIKGGDDGAHFFNDRT